MENSEVDIIRSLSSLTGHDIAELKQVANRQPGSPDAFWDMLQMKCGLRGPEAWCADPVADLDDCAPDELSEEIELIAERYEDLWSMQEFGLEQKPAPFVIWGKGGIGRTFIKKRMSPLYDVCVLDSDSELLQRVLTTDPPRRKNYFRELYDRFRNVKEPAEMRVFVNSGVVESNILTKDENQASNKPKYLGLLCLEWGAFETRAMRDLSWQLIQNREYDNWRLGEKWYVVVAIDDTKEPPTSDSCKIGEPKIWNYCSHVNLIPDPSLCIDIIEELRNKTRG